MTELVVILRWLAAIAPALNDLYQATSGDSKKSIAVLKRAYQIADAEILKQWEKKGGKNPTKPAPTKRFERFK